MAVKPVTKSKKVQSKQKKEISFPFEKDNFIIIGVGIALIVIGYILMAENSVDGFLPTVISPILLVLGYCVIIPYGILKRAKKPAALKPESSTNVSS
ncbi:MAG: DUF3098 domain-containing protein, partial [Ignavibacteria bacterium]